MVSFVVFGRPKSHFSHPILPRVSVSNGCFGLVIIYGSGCKVARSQKSSFDFCDTLITMMISSSRLDQFPSIQSRNSILSPTPLHFKVKISRTNKKKTVNRYNVYFVIIFGEIWSKVKRLLI